MTSKKFIPSTREIIILEELNHSDTMLQGNWEEEYANAGSFQTALMRLIELSDHVNLKKLETVYPNLVNSFRGERKV